MEHAESGHRREHLTEPTEAPKRLPGVQWFSGRFRSVAQVAFIATMVAFVAVLTLSDRVPLIIRSAHRFVGRRLGDAVSLDVPVTTVDGHVLDLGHLVVWALVSMIAVLLVRRPWPALLAVGFLVFASTGLEVAQDLVTSSRDSRIGDLYSNLIGIGVGGLIGAGLTIGAQVARRSYTP
jgi:hypothetical protein